MHSLCPACESELVEIRSKRVCPFCYLIVETCCDGGECRPAIKSGPERWREFVNSHAQARLDYIEQQRSAQ